MDRPIPSKDHACKHGLPSYPAPLERMLLELVELPEALLTPEELDLLDAWIESRRAPIREAKRLFPEDQGKVFRWMGWQTRKEQGRT